MHYERVNFSMLPVVICLSFHNNSFFTSSSMMLVNGSVADCRRLLLRATRSDDTLDTSSVHHV